MKELAISKKFSLHTEYSYGKRNFSTNLISSCPIIRSCNKKGVPQLWFSEEWAKEFAYFIKQLCEENVPEIIEIHPPFSDYTSSLKDFIVRYKEFEQEISSCYPFTKILIENRSGSTYSEGKFIVSKGREMRELSELIYKHNLILKITLDLPQLLTSYGGPQNLNEESLHNVLERQNELAPFIKGIHLWGKKRSNKGRLVAHSGDLTTYFEDNNKKEIFLNWLYVFLNDGTQRYFVPEVNSSNEDLRSIIDDLEKHKIKIG